MFIAKAYAQTVDSATDLQAAAPEMPGAMETFAWNMGMVVVLMALFYILIIAPQQKRFREHSRMLADLKKGDDIVTGGGLLGKIEKVIDDHEILIDLGNGLKVTALRSTIQARHDVRLKSNNDNKTSANSIAASKATNPKISAKKKKDKETA